MAMASWSTAAGRRRSPQGWKDSAGSPLVSCQMASSAERPLALCKCKGMLFAASDARRRIALVLGHTKWQARRLQGVE